MVIRHITELPATLQIGPRVQAEIKRRIRELESRAPRALTPGERKELHKLQVFLHLSQTGGES